RPDVSLFADLVALTRLHHGALGLVLRGQPQLVFGPSVKRVTDTTVLLTTRVNQPREDLRVHDVAPKLVQWNTADVRHGASVKLRVPVPHRPRRGHETREPREVSRTPHIRLIRRPKLA